MSERTKFGADLIQAMSEAAPHAHGKDVPGIRVHCVDVGTVEAKAVRKKLDLTQHQFVRLQKMEASQAAAERGCAYLLRIMKGEPEPVLRALSLRDEASKIMLARQRT